MCNEPPNASHFLALSFGVCWDLSLVIDLKRWEAVRVVPEGGQQSFTWPLPWGGAPSLECFYWWKEFNRIYEFKAPSSMGLHPTLRVPLLTSFLTGCKSEDLWAGSAVHTVTGHSVPAAPSVGVAAQRRYPGARQQRRSVLHRRRPESTYLFSMSRQHLCVTFTSDWEWISIVLLKFSGVQLFDKYFLWKIFFGMLWIDFTFNSVYATSTIFVDQVSNDFSFPSGSSPSSLN